MFVHMAVLPRAGFGNLQPMETLDLAIGVMAFSSGELTVDGDSVHSALQPSTKDFGRQGDLALLSTECHFFRLDSLVYVHLY